MSDSVIPVVLMIAGAVATAAAIIVLSALIGRPRRSVVDTTPYECGMRPFSPVQEHRHTVRFYLVAMIFILFDIEAAFLYPWAVTFKGFAASKVFVLVEMMVFLGILIVGFAYLWRRGALDWD